MSEEKKVTCYIRGWIITPWAERLGDNTLDRALRTNSKEQPFAFGLLASGSWGSSSSEKHPEFPVMTSLGFALENTTVNSLCQSLGIRVIEASH